MQFINKKKLNTAFTLVETLVAISIFTGAILGLLSFSAGSISDTNYAKNKLIATYLSEEGLEYMRNLRDTYILFESDGWTGFRDKLAVCETEAGCYFDPAGLSYAIPSQQAMKSLTLTACSTNCPTMFYDDSAILTANKYNYDVGGLPTSFIRKIKVTDVTNAAVLDNKEILIESTVFWKKGDKTFSVSFSNYLKNWAE
jgi:Tfp pilus assembly protein PilV